MLPVNETVQTNTGLRVYRIKGVDKEIIARKGGPSAFDIKSKDSYEVLRKNQQEFSAASMISKTLRDSLPEQLHEICETHVSGKLTAKFRNIAKYGEGDVGSRPIILSKYGMELNGFDFNSNSPYNQIFGAKYFIKQGSQRGHLIFHFPEFVPTKSFVFPEDATNFKLNASLIALSDHHFSHEKGYFAMNEQAHGLNSDYETNMLPMLKISIEPITFQLSIPFRGVVPQHIGLFLIMGIRFYQYKDKKFIHLKKGGSMQIMQVY